MRISTASAAASALVLLFTCVTAQGGFPALSTVEEGGASKTSNAAEGTAAATSGDFPTISAGDGSIPTYPPPAIPPTGDAPFMQKSALPQGTVFICVGAVLGFLLACVIAWRGFMMWTVHRNIRRANIGYVGLAPQGPATKNMGAGILEGGVGLLKKGHFYGSKANDGSNMSLSPLTVGEPKSRSTSGNALANSTTPSKSSLFFSPTAGVGSVTSSGGVGAGLPASNLGVKRGEGYLPSGYYAGSTPPDRNSQRYSMADFDPRHRQSSDYGGPGSVRNQSRPDLLDNRRESQVRLVSYESRRDSSYGSVPGRLTAPNLSSVSLGNGEGRAPSAYLEDLFSAPPVPENDYH